jgi:mono/diheme cytochrome c family protein
MKMKKALKIIGIVLLVIIAIGATGFIVINSSDIPSYPTADFDYQVKVTPEAVARGEKLARTLCAGCHMDHKTRKLTGTQMLDAPPEFGTIYSANITQDKTYGIGNWTDAELVYLLRTGIKRNGQYAPPYMAKLPNMADEDINAIIAFLRSDHPLIKADATPDKPCEPSFLTKMLSRVAWKPFPMPNEPISLPDSTNMTELGRYLAHNLDCFSCHSADFKSNDFLEPEKSVGYFAGGNQPLDKEGRVMLTPNLTPHPETGIGSWTDEQFIKAVKYGIKENEPSLQYPMSPYSRLTDTEARAIYQYLQTIPAIENKVQRSIYQ